MKKILKYVGILFAVLIVIGIALSDDTEQQTGEQTTEQLADKTTENKVEDTVKDTEKAETKTEDPNKLTDEKRAKIVEYFKGDDEKQVKDATFINSTLSLGMINDGSSRDGFAEYACQVLKDDFKVKELVVVKIVDIGKLVSENKIEKIGEKNCNYDY